MKRKPVPIWPAPVLKDRVPSELQSALTVYTAYYRETTGRTIEVWPLVVQMLQQFLDTDWDSQRWRRRTRMGPWRGPRRVRRRTQNGPGAGLTTS